MIQQKNGLKLKLEKVEDEICGDQLSLLEFVKHIIDETFIDYDGYCEFVVDTEDGEYYVTNAGYSIDCDTVIITNEPKNKEYLSLLDFCSLFKIKKVIWYNR